MRFSLIAIATVVASVAAQDLSKIPACAIPCFVPAIQGSGCGLSDVKCQCTTGRQSIQDSVASCVPSRCQANDIAALTSVVGELCASAGVTVTDLPSAAPSGSGAAATSAVNGTASRTQSRTATGTAPATASTAAAVANLANIGAVAMGLAAFAL